MHVSASSARPWASLAMTFAVAGAISNRSASSASRMWVGFQPSSSSYRSVTTGLRESVLKGSGVMNRCASAVITTRTLHVLLGQQARQIRRLVRGDGAGHAENNVFAHALNSVGLFRLNLNPTRNLNLLAHGRLRLQIKIMIKNLTKTPAPRTAPSASFPLPRSPASPPGPPQRCG